MPTDKMPTDKITDKVTQESLTDLNAKVKDARQAANQHGAATATERTSRSWSRRPRPTS